MQFYEALRRLYGFCAGLCMSLCNISGFAYVVRMLRVKQILSTVVQILRVKRLERMYTDFAL